MTTRIEPPAKPHLRNIAIIAHVDHGKTTLLDGLLKQSGTFREHQEMGERIMDNMDLERERGITIMAKNTSIHFRGTKINIVDTPGHADFGGEVERSLHMVDGAVLLVDASEGPLPQTRFVLHKALAASLPILQVINKIDRKDARIQEVINEVSDLFIDLGADPELLDLPVIFTNAKLGHAHVQPGDGSTSLLPLFEALLEFIPGPRADDDAVPQFLVTNLDYDPYVGQLALGRLFQGRLQMGTPYTLCGRDGASRRVRFSGLYVYSGLERRPTEVVEAGDICAVAGLEGVDIGDTVSDAETPSPLPRIHVDEPTVSMVFMVNNGPMAGLEGKFVTSRQIKERLERETRGNVALIVKPTDQANGFEVCGRGELQLAVLIETMRRESFELMVSRPVVITKQVDGKTLEPVEHLFLDIPDTFIGVVTEKLSLRKGRMFNLVNCGTGRASLEFRIPSRGLIGFRGEFLTDTKGTGVMNSLVHGYEPWFGPIPQRTSGALVADRAGRVTGHSAFGLEERGELFVPVGCNVYAGMILGERNRPGDLTVNITREKKLSNMRSSNSDILISLRPPHILTLDQALEFIAEDELVEVTPTSVRMRKQELDASRRESQRKKNARGLTPA